MTSETTASNPGNADVFPSSTRATPTATNPTGGRHNTRAGNQSIFDRYQLIVSVDIGASLVR